MYWRDGVQSGWRDMCRVLFIRLLLSVPIPYTYPNTDAYPHTYAHPHSYA
jgi:hypothetical protein